VSAVLEAARLVAGYGANTVLHGVTLSVDEGELIAMLGLNGAGKSVTLRCLSGLLRPWEGSVTLAGRDITRETPEARVRLGLKMVPQGRGIFPAFTVEQNLRVGGYRIGNREFRARLEPVYDRYPRLGDRRTQRAGTLSGGEQAMLAIGRALIDAPKVMLLDEPTAGLSPAATHEMTDLVRALNADGVTILLVEQSIGVALRLATRVLLMQKGEIIREASPASLRDRSALLDELGAGDLYDAESARSRKQPAAKRPPAKKRPTAGKRPAKRKPPVKGTRGRR